MNPFEETEILKFRKHYYTNDIILKEIVKIAHKHEIAILDFSDENSFFLRSNWFNYTENNNDGVDFFGRFLQAFKIKEYLTRNLFYSSSEYLYMPNMFYKDKLGKLRKKDNKVFFDFVKPHIIKYNVLIDFDLAYEKNRELMALEVLNFCKKLDIYNIKYFIVPSGKGIHVNLLDIDLPKKLDNDTLIVYKKLQTEIKEKMDLKYMCLFNSGVYNRVSKLPLSLSGNKIVLPLDKSEMTLNYLSNLDNFIYNPKSFPIERIRRGLIIHNENMTNYDFLKFIEQFNIDLSIKV